MRAASTPSACSYGPGRAGAGVVSRPIFRTSPAPTRCSNTSRTCIRPCAGPAGPTARCAGGAYIELGLTHPRRGTSDPCPSCIGCRKTAEALADPAVGRAWNRSGSRQPIAAWPPPSARVVSNGRWSSATSDRNCGAVRRAFERARLGGPARRDPQRQRAATARRARGRPRAARVS